MKYVVNEFFDGNYEKAVTVQDMEEKAKEICTTLNQINPLCDTYYLVSEVEEQDSADFISVMFSGNIQVLGDNSIVWDLYDDITFVKDLEEKFEITNDDGDGLYDFLCTVTVKTLKEYNGIEGYLNHMVEEKCLYEV